MTIDRILSQRKIVVTCGTGGVGKTTLSSALAVRAAINGRKAVVVTIDPAKRLATSLGLKVLGDQPHDLTPELRKAAEAAGRECKGTLSALMPDTKLTFESFVAGLAPNPEVAARVMKNPIFQIFAREFSGTNEYMALQKLYSLEQGVDFDFIVLDTPPSRNTLAFLEAPQLLGEFFDEKIIRWLVLPANRLVAGGMRKALGILEKLTGSGFMTHLFEFAAALFDVRVNFTANLRHITRVLESERTGFLLVSAPTPDSSTEVAHFIDSVRSHGFQFDGLALNRTLGYLKLHSEEWPKDDPASHEAFGLLTALQEREARAHEALTRMDLPLFAQLPELARDVHSVEDLFHVAMAFDHPNSP